MTKWIIFGLLVLFIVEYLSAKPVDEIDYDLAVLPAMEQQDLQMMMDAARRFEEPLHRQKRQRQYWNAIYSPSEYYKKRKSANRRNFKSTTQRYSVWDLS